MTSTRESLQSVLARLAEVIDQLPADPSLPRTWDTLYDVPEDVERVTGDYAGTRSEFARSPLSETGWFQRAKGELFSGWVELLADRTRRVTNIKEDQ